MYGTLAISKDGFTVRRRASDYYGIYYYMIGCGCDHEEAEDIASWAELAAIGDEYWPGDPAIEIWMED